jgi:ABC-2 type transport system permease protein
VTRLIAAEFRKLVTTRLWLWLLLASLAWTAGYSALAITLGQCPGGLTPPLSGAAGQHALSAIGAGGAGPIAAILAAAGTTGEFRHRTAAVTFMAEPSRARVITGG